VFGGTTALTGLIGALTGLLTLRASRHQAPATIYVTAASSPAAAAPAATAPAATVPTPDKPPDPAGAAKTGAAKTGEDDPAH
jgi:hypothetical protein